MRKLVCLIFACVFVLMGRGQANEIWISGPEWELISVAERVKVPEGRGRLNRGWMWLDELWLAS